jgi:methylglutaconyl-CoA hydratase
MTDGTAEVDELVRIDRENRVARVTLNRPRRANAFDARTTGKLHGRLREIASDPAIDIVVLAALGKTFCGGIDLGWMRACGAASPEVNRAAAQSFQAMLEQLWRMPQPVLGAIQGPSVGAGIGLVACCDIVIASSSASFRFSEVRLGLVPAIISPFVIERIGSAAALARFLTAEVFDADEAQRVGLVDLVVEPDAFDRTIADKLAVLLEGESGAMKATKRLTRDLVQTLRPPTGSSTAERLAESRARPAAQARLAKFGSSDPQVDTGITACC